ncbi:HalOD1 output domain-containing protein [Natranaeroarchaeum aerophilus]|uniref:Halobacterial output domain-containing protein n=1 Tax=Natranaeroarchaeum aerophilus TaxID=2917711 RepID=A0AAE3FSC0_9EURY|nr:HalOD1 output domain-containing protein [Natranaeroarchaeum aerophilus]MCL9814321.1 hypothetical protein [Natranaeroarchaeum aerophilus]
MDKESFHDLSTESSATLDGTSLAAEGPKAIFEPDGSGSTAEAVVSLVAETGDRDPLDLPPLYDAVDPEALDRLCARTSDSELRVSFEYAGYTVLVEGTGIVHLLDEE